MFEFMQPVADSVGLSIETCLIVSGVFTFIVTLLIINQLVASLSDTKTVPIQTGQGE